MKHILGFVAALLMSTVTLAQDTDDRPKLVVGIVVDQMRNDFLTRYADLYGKGGFKRLIEMDFTGAIIVFLTCLLQPVPVMHRFIRVLLRRFMALLPMIGTTQSLKKKCTVWKIRV